jgi:DNA-binding LytR/AlgR family response regulator
MNKRITRCLIVDDEPPARELLTSYISQLEDVTISAQLGNALDAFSFLQNNAVDLIFLDIQMPRMSGIELLKSLHHTPGVILTTAFREYATEGFDLDVVDYLVKPISFERFMRAMSKYHHYFSKTPNPQTSDDVFNEAYFFAKVNRDQVKIYFRNILFIESIKDYIKIATSEKVYITYERLTHMEEKLPDGRFLRIHKSYIISLANVKSFRNDTVKIGEVDLPVGRVYKQKFQDAFHKLKTSHVF